MKWRALPLLLVAVAMPLAALPEGARPNLETARMALLRSDGIAAEAELQRALDAGAGKDEVAADMGEALIQQGERSKARAWLEPGRFAKDQAARGWRLLGMLERLDGHLPAAGKALDRALALGPNDPLLWVEIGRLRYQGGEHLPALEAAQRALAAGPDDPRALEFAAQLTRDANGDAAALPFFERALATAPEDLLLLGGYAASLGELGRASEMLAVTRRMISLDEKNPRAFFLQAVLAARAGQVDLARTMLNHAGDRLDDVPAAILLSGTLELEAGNANVAAELLGQLADRQGANQRVQLLLARALYESGDYQHLFARFGDLGLRGDAPPYLLTILGRAHEEQGDRAAAASFLDRAAAAGELALLPLAERDGPGVLAPRWEENPGSVGAAGPYIRSLLGVGEGAAARQVAGRFVELHPGSAEALGLLGDVELLDGQPLAALERYAQSAKVRFTDQLALRSAIALERAGRGGQVPGLVANYLALFPGSRLMLRIAANQALAAGDWGQARVLLENLRAGGGNRDAHLLAALSLVQLRGGDSDAALESATRAWQIAPGCAFAAQARGLALATLKRDPDQAGQLLEQARKQAGDNPLLAEARRKLR